MSDPLERLEHELQALEPLTPSSRTRQGVAARLDGDDSMRVTHRRPSWRVYWPAVTALVAACLALIVWSWPTDPETQTEDPVPAVIPTVRKPSRDSSPTWLACRAAANQSPQAFMALLDASDGEVLIPDEPTVPSAWLVSQWNRTTSQ